MQTTTHLKPAWIAELHDGLSSECLHLARIHAKHGLLLHNCGAHQKTRGTRTHGTSLKFRRKRSLRSQQRGQVFAQHHRQTGWTQLHGMGARVHTMCTMQARAHAKYAMGALLCNKVLLLPRLATDRAL